jgi:2,5-furandicarboxylate decarboxylase 1
MKADDAKSLKAQPFTETFREFMERLRAAGELVDIRQPVDIRHIATLVDQSDKALFFHRPAGYDMPVVSGLIRSRDRAIMSMGCTDYAQIEAKLQHGIDHPIRRGVATSPTKERIQSRRQRWICSACRCRCHSIYDGGPMITAGVVIARDPSTA